jgi:predicted DNA-binding transcriptional regulator AlpA
MGDNAPPVDPATEHQRHRDRVLTFHAWCQLNAFSLATGRRIIKSGSGPPVLQLSSRRIGIKESANAAWQASRAR